jgi:transcriptional regulator with XRE-family HTH domain
MSRTLTFTSASDRLATIGISLGDVAQRFGVRRETVSRWRRDGGAFPPPENWREVLATLAEERSENLQAFAQELRGG